MHLMGAAPKQKLRITGRRPSLGLSRIRLSNRIVIQRDNSAEK
jgi:hypothetical protein